MFPKRRHLFSFMLICEEVKKKFWCLWLANNEAILNRKNVIFFFVIQENWRACDLNSIILQSPKTISSKLIVSKLLSGKFSVWNFILISQIIWAMSEAKQIKIWYKKKEKVILQFAICFQTVFCSCRLWPKPAQTNCPCKAKQINCKNK